MMRVDLQDLPIEDVLPGLRAALAHGHEAVLQAPPGAGKTTRVPLAMLEEDWLQGQQVLLLEPRRLAARAAAARMADTLGEAIGETVGYRIRLDSRVSEQTRIEVITEGILTRRLQTDPGLEGVGLVIFDEFHERSLDSDLCLALCLQGRQLFREGAPLKLLVMSATLDGAAVASLLGDAPVVTSEGRQYPVTSHHLSTYRLGEPLVPAAVPAVLRALQEQSGNVLVFLPGQREIRAVGRALTDAFRRRDWHDVHLAPLYGGLSLERQQQAIELPPEGQRKVVLATNVAETSLTIEGVSVVVDSGLVREADFDPGTGMTRLATRRVSQASAAQRQGRAGRLAEGHCYRLWSEEQHQRLVTHTTPEILRADLAPLVLQLFAWGVADPSELRWLDLPPRPAWLQALGVLEQAGAVFSNGNGEWQLTPHGVRLAQVPLHPRLAHMLMVGSDIQATETACLIAAVLSERNPRAERGSDIGYTLELLMGDQQCPGELQGWFKRTWELARRFARIAADIHKPRSLPDTLARGDVVGALLAAAYPDRVARETSRGAYLLANGRAAILPEDDPLAGEAWLAVADLGGQAGERSDRIFSASTLNPDLFATLLSSLVREEELVEWDTREERFLAVRRRQVGALELGQEPLEQISAEARGRALLGVVRRRGLDLLPWSPPLQQWRARVQLLHDTFREGPECPWPDLSDTALMVDLEQWLLPWLGSVRRLEDFAALDLRAILAALLPWPLPLDLERLAPERIAVPSGSSVAIDYSQRPPVLAVKLQEMFGCEETPSVADGRVPLVIHLLSPAQRPLQVTQDLAGFWRGSYQDVRREMKGRYPKHPWPEDPLAAEATRHTRHRLGSSSGGVG
jgi:ATP-dependent helicase HrpB